jgi:hypothetical protein
MSLAPVKVFLVSLEFAEKNLIEQIGQLTINLSVDNSTLRKLFENVDETQLSIGFQNLIRCVRDLPDMFDLKLGYLNKIVHTPLRWTVFMVEPMGTVNGSRTTCGNLTFILMNQAGLYSQFY